MIDHCIQLNNINLHFIENAGERTQAIIFIHGRGLSTESWQEQFKSAVLSNYRLIALDFPGHGKSEHSPNFYDAYSIAGFRDILIKFITELDIREYVLVGLSLGGHIALQALPNLEHCSGAFIMTMPITKPAQGALMYQNLSILGRAFQENPSAEDVRDYAAILLSPNAKKIPEFIENSYSRADSRIHGGILNSLISEAHLDEIEVVNNAQIPIAIVAGSDEQLHNLDYLKNFDLPIWRGAYQMISDAGHLPQWENPSKVNALLRAFCDDCFA